MQITNNFNLSELQCNCGCKMPPKVLGNVLVLAEQLQVLRDALNTPIHITNAYRCVTHNRDVGGAKNSQHLLGKAADIQIEHLTSREISTTIEIFIDEGIMKQGGLATYETFVHYDIRGKKARW